MSDSPDPYTDEEAWNPDISETTDANKPGVSRLSEFPDAITYFDVLSLDRKQQLCNSQISEAFKQSLLRTQGFSDESRVRSRTQTLLEARKMLWNYRQEYRDMIDMIGPRLGHQAFIQWRIAGEPPDVSRWIRDFKPENQSFIDEGFDLDK